MRVSPDKKGLKPRSRLEFGSPLGAGSAQQAISQRGKARKEYMTNQCIRHTLRCGRATQRLDRNVVQHTSLQNCASSEAAAVQRLCQSCVEALLLLDVHSVHAWSQKARNQTEKWPLQVGRCVSPSKLQRILVKMEETSSLSMRHCTSALSMGPLRGLSTANVTAWAEMLEMMGLCTHACSPKQTQLTVITFREVSISKHVTRL